MKIIFKKGKDQNISVELVTGTTTIDFSYVEMIKALSIDNEIEEPVFEGDITDEEKERLKVMLDKIGASIPEADK